MQQVFHNVASFFQSIHYIFSFGVISASSSRKKKNYQTKILYIVIYMSMHNNLFDTFKCSKLHYVDFASVSSLSS